MLNIFLLGPSLRRIGDGTKGLINGRDEAITKAAGIALPILRLMLGIGHWALPIIVLAPLAWQAAIAQQAKRASNVLLVPTELKSKAAALGGRFAKGKERITLAGTISRPRSAPVRFSAVFELPRKVRYQEENAKTVIFDGEKTKSSGQLAKGDTDLLESLFEDSMDGMLYALAEARFFRPLMYRARLDNGRSQGYTGPYFDIYELVLPVVSHGPSTVRRKHFYFNSQTELLDRVLYLSDGPIGGVRVETRFGGWRLVNDTWVPGIVTRAEEGVEQFSLSILTADVGTAKQDLAFTQP